MSLPQVINAWYQRQMAICAGLLGRDTLAREYWERLLTLRPGDARIVESIAHLRAAAGERAPAIELLERAVALDGASARAWFNLGYLRQEAGANEPAIEAFDRALALDAKHDRAHYGRALSLIRVGRVAEAIPALLRNTELQPMSPYGWYQLAHAYHRLGDDDRAREVMKKLAQFEPKVAKQLERETGIDAGVQVPF